MKQVFISLLNISESENTELKNLMRGENPWRAWAEFYNNHTNFENAVKEMTNEEIKQQVKELKKAYKEADKVKTEYYEKQFSDAGLMPVYKFEKLTRKEKNALDKQFGTCYFTLANNKAAEVFYNDPTYVALKLNRNRAFGLFKALDSRYTPSI